MSDLRKDLALQIGHLTVATIEMAARIRELEEENAMLKRTQSVGAVKAEEHLAQSEEVSNGG